MIRIELWPVKPTLYYSMSRNPQVFLTVVSLTAIYVLEDINWSLFYEYTNELSTDDFISINWNRFSSLKFSYAPKALLLLVSDTLRYGNY